MNGHNYIKYLPIGTYIGTLAIWFPTLGGGRWVAFESRADYNLGGGYPFESDGQLHDVYARRDEGVEYRWLGKGGLDPCEAPTDDEIGWTVDEDSLSLQEWLNFIGDPESNPEFGTLTFAFFDDKLTSSEISQLLDGKSHEDVTGLPAPNQETEEEEETGIPLPSTSFASTDNSDAAAIGCVDHVTWEIVNLDNIQPQNTSQSCWLVPANFNIDDSNEGGFLRAGVAGDDNVNNDSQWRNITGNAGGPYDGLSYSTVQLGDIDKSDSGWSQFSSVTDVTYLLPFVETPLPADKRYVFEHIRDGEIRHRWYYQHDENANGQVGVFYASAPAAGGSQYAFCGSTNWQQNDLFVLSVINSTYSFDQIEIND